MTCPFCELIKSRKWEIEGEHFIMAFDSYPVSPGHSLIIAKRHVNSILELNEDEWKELHVMISKAIEYISKTDLKKVYERMKESARDERMRWFCDQMLQKDLNRKPDGFNLGINQGEAAGQTVEHLHIHLIPRYEGDVKDPTGGVRNIIPFYGNYKVER